MAMMNDMELLREYAGGGSEEAFTMLVARHISMVHSVALRHVRDPQQAEEITQAVFVILAKKAGTLPGRTILSGWLFHTARLTAANFLRTEIRRVRREQEAYRQSGMRENQTNDPWGRMAPLLDEAIASLNESERNAIVLRFVEGRDFKEVGTALGATEDSVRMRVNRALEKLRVFLARRGVALSVAVIAGALSANAVQAAPPALLGSVAVAAAKGVSTTASTATLIKETLKFMAVTKLKIAALIGIGILLVSGTAIVAVKIMRTSHPVGAGSAVTPDPAAAALWKLYSQAMAGGLRGPGAEAVIQVMTTHPPVALIRITGLQNPGARGTGALGASPGNISMGATLKDVLSYAYELGFGFPLNRIIVPAELAAARYDYVDTMRQGGREVLQRALKDQFGLVARREMREMDALLMTVKNPDAAGLMKPPDPQGEGGSSGSKQFGTGGMTGNNQTMAMVANQIGELLGATVSDQTGLAGGFDFKLTLPRNASPEDIKQAILDQLGLELTPGADKHQVEFLVAEKMR
jgi:uncharacterized protein (TIGR03435 family)